VLVRAGVLSGALMVSAGMWVQAGAQSVEALPDALPNDPGITRGTVMMTAETPQPELAAHLFDPETVLDEQDPTGGTAGAKKLPRCPGLSWSFRIHHEESTGPCEEDPIQMIVGAGPVAPLSSEQKGELAIRNIVSPFNLLTIVGYSGIYVAANAHSAYGPAFKGFGRLTGYSLAEDVQGEFFGVYAIPSLAHEDPRYHRMPGHPVSIRVLHALAHTVLSRHDDGTLMPNYATLMTYPISDALSDAYVPGTDTSGSAYRNRVLLGYATDPAGALIAEFLPDVAKRVHVRVVFVQQILNDIVANKSNQ
jgi:hypothetical protein